MPNKRGEGGRASDGLPLFVIELKTSQACAIVTQLAYPTFTRFSINLR